MNYKEKLKSINTFIFDIDGVLTDGTVYLVGDEMARSMSTRDGYALQYAIKKGFNIAIISGGDSEGTRLRLNKLGITDVYLGAMDKITVLHKYLKEKNIKKEHTLYMGDDIPDYHVMQEVEIKTCPRDAVPEIKEIADYISHFQGGKGCVRDIVEQTLKAQNKWFGKSNNK